MGEGAWRGVEVEASARRIAAAAPGNDTGRPESDDAGRPATSPIAQNLPTTVNWNARAGCWFAISRKFELQV
jgi:hypothetical protein